MKKFIISAMQIFGLALCIQGTQAASMQIDEAAAMFEVQPNEIDKLDQSIVSKKFASLSRKYHPDWADDKSEEGQNRANEQFKKLGQAKDVLLARAALVPQLEILEKAIKQIITQQDATKNFIAAALAKQRVVPISQANKEAFDRALYAIGIAIAELQNMIETLRNKTLSAADKERIKKVRGSKEQQLEALQNELQAGFLDVEDTKLIKKQLKDLASGLKNQYRTLGNIKI